ncbi:MAG TPA: translation initiation factor IF-1 [Bryobacterales bacterium]|nr:translation initiation factor IF-1 [Bryobacterales bacterium]
MDLDQAVTGEGAAAEGPVRRPGKAPERAPGKVIEALPNAMFRVELEDLSRVLAHVAPRRNKDFLRLLPGDPVEVELSPLDPGRARVVRKIRSER